MQTKKQYGLVWRNPGGVIGCRGFLSARYRVCSMAESRKSKIHLPKNRRICYDWS